MTVLRTVRVAAVQATPVILDGEASVAKAARLLHEAADAGAELAVLPECFVSVYPSNAWAKAAAGFGGADELWERMWLSALDVPGPLLDELIAVCRERGLHAVVGVNERESARPGSLYNTMVTLGPGGLLHKHRKLMPTQHERLFHGIGAGDDLDVLETPAGRIGGLICWENRMPLARQRLYRQAPQIWVAPTADDSDGWIAHMRAIAIESGAFVVAVPQYIPTAAFPDDFPAELPDRDVIGNGGAVIVEPAWGGIVAGPLRGEEGMLVHDCDLRVGLHAKRWFDAVGHYGREDVLGDGGSRPARAAARTTAPAGDPAGGPGGRVGTRLLLEDAHARIWEIRLAPGERLPMHRHVLDYSWTCVSGGRATSRDPGGDVSEISYAPGETRSFVFGAGESMVHDLENAGDRELVFTTVEYLAAANAPLPLER
ncbi:MAG TPA: nitrilase-related carbon-nitrogen hydrolase [Solirubrobacteraceae bacterium]|nr:nitrilase-related carbon-nitrogen hydrolase [Solirubrobacteraceae bacterium]